MAVLLVTQPGEGRVSSPTLTLPACDTGLARAPGARPGQTGSVVDLVRFEQLVIQAFLGWSANGFEVQVDHSPGERSKRSIWITLRGSATEIDLGVSESGKAELAYTKSNGEVEHERFEGISDVTASHLLRRLDELTGRR